MYLLPYCDIVHSYLDTPHYTTRILIYFIGDPALIAKTKSVSDSNKFVLEIQSTRQLDPMHTNFKI